MLCIYMKTRRNIQDYCEINEIHHLTQRFLKNFQEILTSFLLFFSMGDNNRMNDHAYHIVMDNHVEEISNVFERIAKLSSKLALLRGFLLALKSIANRPTFQYEHEHDILCIQEAKTSLDSATKIALTTLFSLNTTTIEIGNSQILFQRHMDNERSKVKLDVVEETTKVVKDSIYQLVRHSYLQNIHEDLNELCQRHGVFEDGNQENFVGLI